MHANQYLQEVAQIALAIDPAKVEEMAAALSKVEGRVYCIGLGGSLSNCIHMAADLRKLCGIDAVSPDNMAELTAWANDHGWEAMFDGYLQWLKQGDAIFVLSVGGGSYDVSRPICRAMSWAAERKAISFGIVGPHGGITSTCGNHVIRIPAPAERVTPHTEAFQAVIWHALVSHPLLQKRATKW